MRLLFLIRLNNGGASLSGTSHQSATSDISDYDGSEVGSSSYDADLDSESFDNPSDVNVSDIHDPASYVGRSLSEDEKLRILTYDFSKHEGKFTFPVTDGRRFNPSWLSSRSWLNYSKSKDGLYCIPCICFSATHHSPFVTTGFKNWKKALGIKKSYIDQHKLSEGHKVAEQKASLFLQQVHQPTSNIGAMLSKQLAEQLIRTKKGYYL